MDLLPSEKTKDDGGASMQDEETTRVPKYGFKVRLDHKYADNGSAFLIPRLSQIWSLIPLFIRYIIYYVKHIIKGRLPLMDYINTQRSKKMYGVPLGGIGTGSIGRGFKGEFCRFQLIPGIYKYNIVKADQFIITIKDVTNGNDRTIFHSLLSTVNRNSMEDFERNRSNQLSSWKSLIDPKNCWYTGLYPRSWTEYDLSKFGIKLICRQISPVVPHNYKDSSLPCSVFVWEVINVSSTKTLKVSIALTFKNGLGDKKIDSKATCNSKAFTYLENEGVVMYNTIEGTPCKYALGIKQNPKINITKCLHFDPNSDGSEIWNQLETKGGFDTTDVKTVTDNVYGEMGIGVCAQTLLQPNKQSEKIEYSLVWDMPVITFLDKSKKFRKYYTRYFSTEGATLKILDYALKQYPNWETSIHLWQKPVLDDSFLPDWYKSAIFNETYFVSDGGTLWLDCQDCEDFESSDPRIQYGRFAYLEGHEYRMYNTYDVHFYASFALVMNWPRLQESLQYDIRDFIAMEITEKVTTLFDGHQCQRKVKNSVPHDVGDPAEQPFTLINSYPIHDVSEWRDLNSKFVLQVFRDYCLLFDANQEEEQRGRYLRDMINACHKVMQKSLEFDIDGDGLIENCGSADQTFDTWVMKGSSAYCGGLWLGALYAMQMMFIELDDTLQANYYKGMLAQAKDAFDSKLWNGNYYNFDCSKNAKTIMADQLCGHWYLRCCGKSYEVFNQGKVNRSLLTVFDNNVMKFSYGSMGAVNGFIMEKGKKDTITIQSEEVWTGVTYAFASHLLFEGLEEEAWKTAGGLFKTLTEDMGMIYETPEAIFENKNYRSIGYMRPLSIWAMQLAVQNNRQRKNNKNK